MHRDDNSQPHALEKTVPIKGMHCASCELLIAEELESIPGVASAQASLKSNLATIMSAEQVSDKDLEKTLKTIWEKIEEQLDYPGIIRVTAIRENKLVEFLR